MALNRFSFALLVALAPAIALAAAPSLQDASQLLHRGKTTQALEEVNDYLAKNAKDPQGRFLKGLILAEMNRTQDAIKVFTGLTEDFPELPEPYNNLAVLYAAQGQYEQAKDALEKAIRTNPTYATAHENLGDIYAKMASQAYDKALQLDKSNTSAKVKLALVREIFTPTALEKAKAQAGAAATSTGQTKSSPANGAAGLADASVEKTIQDWAAAWSARDVPAYLSFYSARFNPPGNMSLSAWQSLRQQRLTSPTYIRVTVWDFKIDRDGNRATASFKERYESNTLKTTVGKRLVLEQEDGAWKIVSER